MESKTSGTESLIADCYKQYYSSVLRFIASRINNEWDAENLTQDVWVRLLTCEKELAPETIVSLIYTIARNLVNDYLRRHYTRLQFSNELMQECRGEEDSTYESNFYAANLASFERRRVEGLPPQRRIIYELYRYEDQSVGDIASRLMLSKRTVENHLRIGRHEVREYMKSLA